jgi:sn-glycerol 3-phosphate transport system substrate-binding protein
MKKKALAGVASGLLALALAACSGNSQPGSDSATEVTLWHGLGGANAAAFQKLIDQFNAQNAGKIHVTAVFQGSYTDLLAKYTASLRDKSNPTVLLSGDVSTGYLSDVKRSVSPEAMAAANPGDLNLADLVDAGKTYYSVGGKLAAVPMNMSTPVLWVNQDLLAKAGVTDLSSLATLDGVAAAAKKVKAATGVAGIDQPFDNWWTEQLTAGAGESICSPDNGRGSSPTNAASLTQPGQKAAFTTMADLYKSGVALDTGVDGNAALTGFVAGKTAMMLNSSGAAGGIGNSAKFNYTALPYPLSGKPATSGTVVGGSAMWLSSTASPAQQVAGWKLISYLASPDAQAAFSQASGYVPVNKKTASLDGEQAFLAGKPAAKTAIDQAASVPQVPATAGCLTGALTAVRAAIIPHIQAAYTGSVSLDDALKAAETDAGKAIAQYQQQLGQ